jgi:hypothetical protein
VWHDLTVDLFAGEGEVMRRLFRVLKEYEFIVTWVAFAAFIVAALGIRRLAHASRAGFRLIPKANAFVADHIGLLALGIILMLVFVTYRIQRVAKRVSIFDLPEIRVVSDGNTLFVGSPTRPHLVTGQAVVQIPPHPTWLRYSRLFPELRGAEWIGDRIRITEEEAETGGQYKFERTFEFPHDVTKLVSAQLHILIDDYCDIAVNGMRLERSEGYFDLHSLDIRECIRNGENKVQFLVGNKSSNEVLVPKYIESFRREGVMHFQNPYGFIFAISVKYRY